MEDRASSNMMVSVIILVVSVIALLLLIIHVNQNNGLKTTATAQQRMDDPLCMNSCLAGTGEKSCQALVDCVQLCGFGSPRGMGDFCR